MTCKVQDWCHDNMNHGESLAEQIAHSLNTLSAARQTAYLLA